jgi:hypothetical protein
LPIIINHKLLPARREAKSKQNQDRIQKGQAYKRNPIPKIFNFEEKKKRRDKKKTTKFSKLGIKGRNLTGINRSAGMGYATRSIGMKNR